MSRTDYLKLSGAYARADKVLAIRRMVETSAAWVPRDGRRFLAVWIEGVAEPMEFYGDADEVEATILAYWGGPSHDPQ